jgi:hypothetical protein
MWHFLTACAVLMTVGCSNSSRYPLADLQAPDKIILFSIDGRDGLHRGQKKDVETFSGFPVLGKIEITDAKQREVLIATLKDAIARKPPEVVKCFWPRHGLQVTEKAKTVEYVICFECSRFEEFVGEELLRYDFLNSDVQPVFDKPLKDAGIPLAPK